MKKENKNFVVVIIFILILVAVFGYDYYSSKPLIPTEPIIKQQTKIEKPKLVLVGETIGGGSGPILVSHNYVYSGESVSIIDVSDSSSSKSVGLIRLDPNKFSRMGGRAKALYARDNYLYVAGDIGIDVFNISDPAKPKEVGHYYNDMGSPRSLAGIDNYLFAGAYFGLYIFDISDPSKPVLIKRHSKEFLASNLFIVDNLLYMIGRGESEEVSPNVFESKDTVRILDISDRTNPTLVGKYKKRIFLPEDTYIYDGKIYIVHRLPENTLTIFDASDLTNLNLLGSYKFKTEGGGVGGVYVYDKYAYAVSGDKLFVVDISDPTKPVLVRADSQNFRSIYSITGFKNFIYLAGSSPERTSQFKIFEIK